MKWVVETSSKTQPSSLQKECQTPGWTRQVSPGTRCLMWPSTLTLIVPKRTWKVSYWRLWKCEGWRWPGSCTMIFLQYSRLMQLMITAPNLRKFLIP